MLFSHSCVEKLLSCCIGAGCGCDTVWSCLSAPKICQSKGLSPGGAGGSLVLLRAEQLQPIYGVKLMIVPSKTPYLEVNAR